MTDLPPETALFDVIMSGLSGDPDDDVLANGILAALEQHLDVVNDWYIEKELEKPPEPEPWMPPLDKDPIYEHYGWKDGTPACDVFPCRHGWDDRPSYITVIDQRNRYGVVIDQRNRYGVVIDRLREVWPMLRGCEHDFDPECARCAWLKPLTEALRNVDDPVLLPTHSHHYGASAAAAPSPAPDAAEHGTGAAGDGTGVAGMSAFPSPPEERNITLPAGDPNIPNAGSPTSQ